MSGRHHEPNGSYYSARYAERKMAAARARDAAPKPETRECICCGAPVSWRLMQTRCDSCRAEYRRIAREQGSDAADTWDHNTSHQRKLRGELP